MKKRIITSVLLLIFAVTSISPTAFGAIDEPREYINDGRSEGLLNLFVTPQNRGLTIVPENNASSLLPIYSYNSTDDTTYKTQGVVIRFPISDVPSDADRITIKLFGTNRSAMAESSLKSLDFVFGIYAIDTLPEVWGTGSKWENVAGEDMETADFRKNKIGEITSESRKVFTTSETSTTVNGHSIEGDITDFVKSSKIAGKSYVDIIILPISHGTNPNDHTQKKFLFENVKYQYGTYENCYKFRPAVNWYSIKKSEINTVEWVNLTNGIINEKFDKSALDPIEGSTEKTYTVGVADETKPVSIDFEISSAYATLGTDAVTEGNVGETLIIPVISEAGVTRTYKFELKSLADAGFTSEGTVFVKDISYIKNEGKITAEVFNSNISDKDISFVTFERKNNALENITVTDKKIPAGYSEISVNFEAAADTEETDIYISLKDNIFVPVSDIISEYTPAPFEKREEEAEIYYKDITKEEATITGKLEKNMPLTALVLKEDKVLSQYDGTNEKEIFAYGGALKTDKDGYYGFDTNLPSTGNYTALLTTKDGYKKELSFFYASYMDKQSVLSEVYGATDEAALKNMLNLGLSKEERKALDDKYNETDGAEGQKDFVKVLNLSDTSVKSGISEDALIKYLFKFTKEDTDKDNFSDCFAKAELFAEIYSAKTEDIEKYNDKIGITEDILDIYGYFSTEFKKYVSAERLSGIYYDNFDELKAKAREEILLASVKGVGNADKINRILLDYTSELGISSSSIAVYNSLGITLQQVVITDLIYSGPYTDKATLGEKFAALVSAHNIVLPGGSFGGGGGGSSSGKPQNIEVSGQENRLPEIPAEETEPERECLFNDLDGYTWAEKAIKSLYKKRILDGISEDKFNPSGKVKREEFVKMTSFLYEASGKTASFTDITEGAWYIPYINKAISAGIINGVSGKHFGIGNGIKREDAAVIIYRILNPSDKPASIYLFKDDSSISDYARNAVYYLKDKGILAGTDEGKFEPEKTMNRAEAAVLIERLSSL